MPAQSFLGRRRVRVHWRRILRPPMDPGPRRRLPPLTAARSTQPQLKDRIFGSDEFSVCDILGEILETGRQISRADAAVSGEVEKEFTNMGWVDPASTKGWRSAP